MNGFIRDVQIKRKELDFLEKNAAAKIFILDVLYKKKDWVCLKELEFLGKMTNKTVQKYIAQLDEEIQALYPNGELQILQDRTKGYLLSELREGTVEEVQQHIFLGTLAYQLMSDIFFEDFVSIVQFARQNHVSESTINRMIRLFRKKLQAAGLSIETGTLIITGDEPLIRQFIAGINWSTLRGDHWIYRYILQETMVQLVAAICDFFSIKLSYFKRKQLQHFLAISLVRINNGHEIKLTDTMHENLDDNPIYQEFRLFIYNQLPGKMKTETEIGFLFLYLMTNDYFYQDQAIEQGIMSFHHKHHTELYQSIQLFDVQVAKRFPEAHFSADNEIKIKSYLMSAHAFSQLFPGMTRNSVLENSLKQGAAPKIQLRTMLRKMLIEMNQEFSGGIFANHDFLLSHYVMIFSLLDQPLLYEPEIEILLLTDLSRLDDEKIMRQIKSTFLHTFNIKISTNRDDFSDKPHIVLATGHIPLSQEVRMPLIILKNSLTIQDFSLIEKTIKKYLASL